VRTTIGSIVAVLLLAAGNSVAQVAPGPGDLPPPGYGTLNQDMLTVQFTDGDVQVRFLPLDERLLRLIAPDGYQSLHGVVVARRQQIDSAARAANLATPGLALISFFGLRDGVTFDPQNFSLSYRNQVYRPAAIVPLTANFTGRQLQVRRQASAIFIFEVEIPIFEQFSIIYGSTQSDAWTNILPTIERERGRVLARSQVAPKDSTGRKP
jgi:hypothetical protein